MSRSVRPDNGLTRASKDTGVKKCFRSRPSRTHRLSPMPPMTSSRAASAQKLNRRSYLSIISTLGLFWTGVTMEIKWNIWLSGRATQPALIFRRVTWPRSPMSCHIPELLLCAVIAALHMLSSPIPTVISRILCTFVPGFYCKSMHDGSSFEVV